MTEYVAAGITQWEPHRFHPQSQYKHLGATIDKDKEGVATRTTLGNVLELNLVEDLPRILEAHARTGADKLACLKKKDEHLKQALDEIAAIPAKVVLLNFVYAFSIN